MTDAPAKRLRDWNDGADDVPATYTHDALEFQQDLRTVLTERDDYKADYLRRHRDACERAEALRAMTAERDAALAEAARLREEVASLRLTLGGRTFDASVPEPIGCPLPGACQTVAEIVRLREAQSAWLALIQAENSCAVTGKPCGAKRCGCAAEQELFVKEASSD